MRLRSIIAGLLGLSLGVWLTTGHAEAYRWTGSDGVVHFSQTPPNDRSASQVRDTPIGTISGSASGTAAGTPAPAPTKPSPNEKAQTSAAPPAQASKQACETARSNLSLLESGRRIRVQMPDGSTHWLEQAERQKRLKETKGFLTQHCK